MLVHDVSFSRVGDGREMGDRGTLCEDRIGRGGEERTGVFSLKDSLRGEHRGAQRCLGGEPSMEAGRLQPFSSPVRLRGLRGSLSDKGEFNTLFLGD